MRIDSAGNVGIGTSSPNAILELNRNFAGEIGAFIQNPNAGGYVAVRLGNSDRGTNGDHLIYGSSVLGLRSKTGAAITFEPAGTERMRITSAGNVGIGTSSPSERLDTGTGNTRTQALVISGDQHLIYSAASTELGIRIGTGGPFYGIGTTGSDNMRLNSASGGDMLFAIASTERMRINNSGKVLIGGGTINAALGDMVLSKQSSGTATFALESQGSWNATISASAAGNMVFSNPAASERMRIDASGNVGIGTSSPGTRLQVRDAAAPSGFSSTAVRVSRDNYGADFIGYIDQGVGHGAIISTVDNGTPTERMRITGAGNVGIGTSAPGVRLDVIGNATFGRGGGTFQGISLTNGDNSASAETVSFIDARNNLGTADGHMFFGHQTDGGSYITWATTAPGNRAVDRRAERMRIQPNGNVGIGLTNPGYPLTVQAATNSEGIRIVGRSSDSVGTLEFTNSAQSATQGYIQSNGNNLLFATSTSVRMCIDSSGNVGIGTTSPGVRLDVVGGAIRVGNTHSMQFRNAAGTGTAVFTLQSDDNFVIYNAAGAPIQSFTQGATNTAVYGSNASNRMIVDSGNNVISWNVNGSERMRITNGGEVYIAGTTDQGAFNLQCNGTGVWGAGAYVNGSDRNLKEEVAPLADALDVVAALKPVTFRYKKDYSRDQSIQPGFIAQELQEALADQVYLDGVVQAGPKHLNVAYQSLIPVLVKALQEANEKIDTLAARVAQLEGN
jgi:hypothetical protein